MSRYASISSTDNPSSPNVSTVRPACSTPCAIVKFKNFKKIAQTGFCPTSSFHVKISKCEYSRKLFGFEHVSVQGSFFASQNFQWRTTIEQECGMRYCYRSNGFSFGEMIPWGRVYSREKPPQMKSHGRLQDWQQNPPLACDVPSKHTCL